RFAKEFGDEGHRQGWCLYHLGCKGPETWGNCSTLQFCDVGGVMYILEAEIIELNSKPTVPVGELGVDAFLQSKTFVDRGIRRRA
ncbi:hypothetical protein MJN54_33745, partial [Salmonella enterica subsp. enterica serovar Kentucky]|nr:hypothetical protein [Salmonella enterica subsp. enterica serovar Kentucky]